MGALDGPHHIFCVVWH